VLRVNYRGSLGAGEDFVRALPGKAGFLDVADCHAAVQLALSRRPELDPSKVALFGGSHGGFLVLHLAAQYPVSLLQ
jgi:acylaminoacyl-peptidase